VTLAHVIALIGIASTISLAVLGALLGLVVRGSERRVAEVERKLDEAQKGVEGRRVVDQSDHAQLTARVHATEVEIARLQSLHELRPELNRVHRTLDLLLQEVAGLKGSLRPWSRTPSQLLPSEPPKRGT
jgi:uncharacterized protein YoxC